MRLHRDGIKGVFAVPLPEAIAADGCGTAVSVASLVTWRSSHEGMLHQVYLNGRFAGATLDVDQRQLVVQPPSSFLAALRVEVAAVEAQDAHLDFSNELDPPSATGRIRLVLLQSQALPPGARFNVYFDHGAGAIDYAAPLNESPIPAWPCPQDKAGFGMAAFGAGDFGHDSPACIGFGRGRFAEGPFGMDAGEIEWISPLLPLGRYRFGVKTLDASGNESPACETSPIAVVPPPRPAAALHVALFDPQTHQITLRIGDS
ncbi:MAG TPA: hypothetical protein VLI39_01715 [Sedimentisphaerales bacterium]|nr:hypothetical protein [Sedimentisphaerales bacterium]